MRDKKHQQYPELFYKAEQLFHLVDAFSKTINEDDILQASRAQFMLEDALALAPKIAGAEAVEMYAVKMQNAALIRKHAMDLYVNIGSFRFEDDTPELDYINLIREEIEEFRLLFVDWVASFDPWNYSIDRWGMFNPPGVSAHDKDPDDDLPPRDDHEF